MSMEAGAEDNGGGGNNVDEEEGKGEDSDGATGLQTCAVESARAVG